MRNLTWVWDSGWLEESPVPMLVLAPFHVEEHYLAHWNALRISKRSHDHHMIIT